MKPSKSRNVALTGLLFALAIVLSVFESLLAPFLGLPPGIKLGLANVLVMYAVLYISRKQALLLVVLKTFFALLTRGPVAGFISLSGGMFSFLVLLVLLLPKNKPSVFVFSVCSALGHNAGQLLGARLLLGRGALYYGPVLLISGVVMGAVTAVVLRVLLPALEKTGEIGLKTPWQKNDENMKENPVSFSAKKAEKNPDEK